MVSEGGDRVGPDPPQHQSILRPRSELAPPTLGAEIYRRLGAFASTDVSDLVGRLYTMDAGIRPLYAPIARVCGPAVTVRLPPGDSWAIARALTSSAPGSVVVVDWMGYHDGCGSGANAIAHAMVSDLAGLVIDGCWRDIGEIQALGFPIFGRGVSPYSPPKRQPGEFNVPVSCGGVIVQPGDAVIADADGVAVVPRAEIASVLAALPDTPPEVRGSLEEYPAADSLLRRARAYDAKFGSSPTR